MWDVDKFNILTAFISIIMAVTISYLIDVFKELIKKPSLRAAVLGIQRINQTPKQLCVTLSIKNEGDDFDILEASHIFLSEKEDDEYSNYAMDIEGNGVWSFAKPIFCAPKSITHTTIAFWVNWDNTPHHINLKFNKSGRIAIEVMKIPKVKAIFEKSASDIALAYSFDVANQDKGGLSPYWFGS